MTQNRRAFTLWEILVVLAIVALLSALLLGAFSRVREGGRRATCSGNEKQIHLAFQLYLADSGGFYPRQSVYQDSPQSGTWSRALAPFIKTLGVFHCPSDALWPEREKAENALKGLPRGGGASSYIVDVNEMSFDMSSRPQMRLRGEARILSPASTVLLTDGASQVWGARPYWAPYIGDIGEEQNRTGNALVEPTKCTEIPVTAGITIDGSCGGQCSCYGFYAPDARHHGRANVLFFDGHVKAMENSAWYFPGTPYLDPKRGG